MGVKYRHIRSNSIYEVLHFGYDEATMKPIVIYRNEDGIVFSRNMHTFFDGRFEVVVKEKEPNHPSYQAYLGSQEFLKDYTQ